MYRCEVCQSVSKPGQAAVKHALYRQVWVPYEGSKTRLEVERELMVCKSCAHDLELGIDLADLLQAKRPKIILPTPTLNVYSNAHKLAEAASKGVSAQPAKEQAHANIA